VRRAIDAYIEDARSEPGAAGVCAGRRLFEGQRRQRPHRDPERLERDHCQHGVNMKDPTFSSNGGGVGLTINGAPGSEARTNAAQKACQPIMDKAQQDAPRPSAAEQAKMRDRLLAFAKCMRAHGVDMPDPTFDGNGSVKIQTHGSASGPNNSGASSNGVGAGPPKDPKFQAASKACQSEGHGGPGFSLQTAGQ